MSLVIDRSTPFVRRLTESLHFLKMSGVFYCRSEFKAPWGVEVPAFPDHLFFHVVMEGECFISVEHRKHIKLKAGDLVLGAHGARHVLCDSAKSKVHNLFDLPSEQISERYEILKFGGEGQSCNILCGVLRVDNPYARHLVKLLPAVINIDIEKFPHADWLKSAVQMIFLEARELKVGGETVVTHLADILVIQVIRAWIEQSPTESQGWLGAMSDPELGRVLSLIHNDPSRSWTIAQLAKKAGMSRASLAARFSETVGEPVIQYLTRWRMHLARAELEQGKVKSGDLAARLGYQSEAAFRRAFKRFTGMNVGEVKRTSASRSVKF